MKQSPKSVEVLIESTKHEDNKGQSSNMSGSVKKLIICAAGIFLFYFYYGILQEKITRGKYGEGENTEKFTYTLALVFVQCIINAIFAKAVLVLKREGPDETPKKFYPVVAFTYIGAMLASNQALLYINYPTQVLGKSVKPIPIMILGVLFARKRYPLAKYACVLMIVAGVALFMFKDKKPNPGVEGQGFGMGEILLLVSLTFDGLTGATQDRMKLAAHTKPHHMMFNMNIWSVFWVLLGLLWTGEGLAFLSFVQRHPYVLVNIIIFSLCSALGQNFIFITVTTFGPLMCSILTTTRKFFTILLSVLVFSNPMSQRQWIGTVLVFIGLALDSKYGKEKKKH